MSLFTLGRGNNLNMPIDPAALTQSNTPTVGDTNTLITADTPKGVLGGSLAGIVGDNIAGKANPARPIGWVVNNAQGDPFDNSPAVASEMLVFHINPNGLMEIDIYETCLEGTATPLVYAVDDELYTSQNGLATNEAPGGNAVDTNIIGHVMRVPTATNPKMLVQSKL